MKLAMVAGFTVSDHSPEDLEHFLDRVMEELLDPLGTELVSADE